MGDQYQSLGLIATAALAGSVSLLLWHSEVDHAKSISQHAALSKSGFVLFGLISTISATLLYIFMRQWFIPYHELSPVFSYLLLTGVACQLIAAWTPDANDGRLISRIHQFFAYTMAAIMPVLLVWLAVSPGVPFVGRVVCGLVGFMMFAYSVLAMLMPRLHQKYLIHQVIYIAVFYCSILVVTYT
jgi:hypothetical protein